MNDFQKVASDISGYMPNDAQGAENEYYYTFLYDQIDEKINMIIEYGQSLEMPKLFTDYEARKIIAFLDAEFSGEHEKFFAFKKLA